MKKSTPTNATFIKIALFGITFYCCLGLIYHTRWFIPYLLKGMAYVVPEGQIPLVWFIVQICDDMIFLTVCYLLIRLFKKYDQTGFFDSKSLKVLDGIILSCLVLGLLGVFQIVANNFDKLHIGQWTSSESSTNLIYRSFTNLLILKVPQPQTMYILLAVVLWVVKQFVMKALNLKQENESFI